MTSLIRSVRNFFKVGPKEAYTQMLYIGDIKAGTLVGVDKFGNKYYENNEEIYGRERWVDYAQHYGDASQIPADWHGWIHKITDTPPTVDSTPKLKFLAEHKENFTGTRKAYKPYSTTVPKVAAWEPK
ncbi:110_t:CDS:2, partial [Acaulospora morrowiae]